MVIDAKPIPPHESMETFEEQSRRLIRLERERVEFDQGFSNVIFKDLTDEISNFQSTLKDDEEIGVYISSFGQQVLVRITSIRPVKPYLIIFEGINDNTGARVRLVQHVSQTSVLFEVAKVPDGREASRIGFL